MAFGHEETLSERPEGSTDNRHLSKPARASWPTIGGDASLIGPCPIPSVKTRIFDSSVRLRTVYTEGRLPAAPGMGAVLSQGQALGSLDRADWNRGCEAAGFRDEP